MKKWNHMNLTVSEKDTIYDFLTENKKDIVFKRTNIGKIKSIIDLILTKFKIDLTLFLNDNHLVEDLIEYLTNHWDKKCKNPKCQNERKSLGLLVNRSEYNNCIEKYGIYKFCGEKCNYESISNRQKGENNTCHRMSEESFRSMCDKNSKIMKDKIRDGEFIPNITNSWANSRCEIEFIRDGEMVIQKTRSTWEAFFQLKNPNLLYEKLVIPYSIDGVDRNYIVDFVDHDNKIIYEIKPLSNRNSKIVKIKEEYAKKWCESNEYKLIFITDDWFFENYPLNKELVYGQPSEQKIIKNLKQFDENKKY